MYRPIINAAVWLYDTFSSCLTWPNYTLDLILPNLVIDKLNINIYEIQFATDVSKGIPHF